MKTSVQKNPEHIGLMVQLHPADFRYLEAAASASRIDIEDFAALAIYQRSKETIAEHQKQNEC